MNTRITLQALALTALSTTTTLVVASDHLDTQAVIADPASDIDDLYAWMSPDGRRLNLVMTIVGKKFSDHVRYAFRIDSGQAMGKASVASTIECDFSSAVAPQCRLDDFDIARGDANAECGVESEKKLFRVFVVPGEDPSWRHIEDPPDTDVLATLNAAALVIEVNINAVNNGEPLSGVWATTTVRAAPPGHPPLEEGVVIDRMGRALTELTHHRANLSTCVRAELGWRYAV